jgi:hypothetical protein
MRTCAHNAVACVTKVLDATNIVAIFPQLFILEIIIYHATFSIFFIFNYLHIYLLMVYLMTLSVAQII